MNIAKIQSDYDPDTFLRIIITEDMDISLAIYGKGEMKIAGINGGGYLKSERKIELIKTFSNIVDILNKK